MKVFLAFSLLLLISIFPASAQDFNAMDADGNITQRGNTFNPHGKNDTTNSQKEVPRGLHVWTVDRRFGDITKAEIDTMPHLFPQTTIGTGRNLQYNTVGSNYTARLSRIFADRPAQGNFYFTDTYDQVLRQPDEWHFTNTYSPITNLTYDKASGQYGEDHVDARFAVNADKRTGLGFDLNYLYARGFYQNQNASHFGATFYTSYLGDHYQMHALFSTHHQKTAENGGITNDNYVTHPELYTESFSDNEIPTVLDRNWNRNDNQRLFLTHRYALGFYRKVPMTEEELKARQFAKQAAAEKEARESGDDDEDRRGRDRAPQGRPDNAEVAAPQGRPEDAQVMGDAPVVTTDSLLADTTRIRVDSKAQADSLMAAKALEDSIEATMKREFVPVTSFIHTLDVGRYDRTYLAYWSPEDYYANTYFNDSWKGYGTDSIYDNTRLLNVRNTVAIALLEGFNKYVPAGLKAFAAHDLRRYEMPELITVTDEQTGTTTETKTARLGRWSEHSVSIGGQLQRTQGTMLHYNLLAETWLAGEDAGQLKVDAQADLNFPLFGDTVRLAAKAYFYRLNPSFVERRYHSKHFWWDNDLSKETRSRVEGIFSYEKTNTRLRVAIEEIQNYTYLGMDYKLSPTLNDDGTVDNSADLIRSGLTAAVRQHDGNVSILTAQLDQRLRLGPLHWDNIVTWQNCSNTDVLPLPELNVFSNLYLEFMVAHVLRVELGAAATWFSKYKAPDFLPHLNRFAVQENETARMELGNFPFVDAYANLHLKHARFFIMLSNATANNFDRMTFLTPHYPLNRSTLHLGVSWNFFN
ncbi:MAG: putative porin [Prevotella sp.]|nr:putative porin [Prevotella sp.]